jgi:hypothetical protein
VTLEAKAETLPDGNLRGGPQSSTTAERETFDNGVSSRNELAMASLKSEIRNEIQFIFLKSAVHLECATVAGKMDLGSVMGLRISRNFGKGCLETDFQDEILFQQGDEQI